MCCCLWFLFMHCAKCEPQKMPYTHTRVHVCMGIWSSSARKKRIVLLKSVLFKSLFLFFLGSGSQLCTKKQIRYNKTNITNKQKKEEEKATKKPKKKNKPHPETLCSAWAVLVPAGHRYSVRSVQLVFSQHSRQCSHQRWGEGRGGGGGVRGAAGG